MPRFRPFKAIEFLCAQAESATFHNTGFKWYETADGFHCRSYENMMAVGVDSTRPNNGYVKPTMAGTTRNKGDRDVTQEMQTIFSYEVIEQFNLMKLLGMGGVASRVLKTDLFNKTFSKISLSNIILGISFLIVWAIIIYKLYTEFQATETEVPITWFAILNSLFIIIFAPLFTKWWDSKYNPPASVKYGLGLIIMAIGFGLLAFATKDIPLGAKTAKLSMIWLVLAYLFHTLGELCLSPMGLSYLSKLVPARMVAFMFGVYYLAIAIGNKLAHYIGGDIEKISQESGLSYFFLIFTIVPIGLGLVSFALHPLLKKLMHGVR